MYPTDNLEKLLPHQKRDKYFRDLQKGKAKPEDFERYIYGGNYDRKITTDETDKQEDKARGTINQWDNETKHMLE